MADHADPLDDVVRELNRRQGDLVAVARGVGISYDTVLRIKRRENDPGYSKVMALHRYLFGETPAFRGQAELPFPPSAPTAERESTSSSDETERIPMEEGTSQVSLAERVPAMPSPAAGKS